MAPPYVVKPNNEGSSVGVQIVRTSRSGYRAQRLAVRPRCAGRTLRSRRELTVAVLGDRPLTVTEIRPRHGFYDYHAKYTEQAADHLLPAPIPEVLYEQALAAAQAAHRLGCRGVSRADFRLDDTEPDGLYLLEVNTTPA